MSDLGITDFQDVEDSRCADRSSLRISNGVVCYGGITAMSEAEYICDTNFLISDESLRVCQRDGFWTGETPQCSELVSFLDFFVAVLLTKSS